MKKSRLLIALLVGLLLLGGGGGAAAWYMLRPAAKDKGEAKPEAAAPDRRNYKYVTLDKVLVMLRSREGEPLSHYLAVDLVFKTPVEQEGHMKEQLPLLRSLAVKALSGYTLDAAGRMGVDQFAAALNRAYAERYRQEQREQPFAEVMIGRLIIE